MQGFSGSSGEPLRDPRGGGRIAEALGAHGHERGPDIDQITRVRGALNAAHADHGDAHARRHGGDLREGEPDVMRRARDILDRARKEIYALLAETD